MHDLQLLINTEIHFNNIEITPSIVPMFCRQDDEILASRCLFSLTFNSTH